MLSLLWPLTARAIEPKLHLDNWGGHLASRYIYQENDQDYSWYETERAAMVYANGHIWEPWFIRLGGKLELKNRDATQEYSTGEKETVSTIATGRAQVNVLPKSPLPFSLTYMVSDGDRETETDLLTSTRTDTTYRRQELRLRQGYLRRESNYLAGYDHNVHELDDEKTTTDEILLNMNTRWDQQTLRAEASYFTSDYSGSRLKTDIYRLKADHVYTPSEELRVVTNANHSDIQVSDSGTAGATTDTHSISSIVNSIMQWNPKDMPLYVGVNALGSRYETHANGEDTESISGSLSANAVYRFREHFMLTGAAGVDISRADGDTSTANNQSVALAYNPDTITLRGFNYHWGARSEVSRSQNEDDTQTHSSVGFLHGLARNWSVLGGSLNSSVSEDINYIRSDSESGNEVYLTHNGNLGWTRGGRVTTTVQLTASDQRIFGDDDKVIQQYRAMAMANSVLDRYNRISGNIAFNRTERREDVDGISNMIDDVTNSVSSDITYRFTRPFGLHHVNFESSLDYLWSETTSHGRNINNALSKTERLEFKNRLTHRIGRLYTTLSANFRREQEINDILLEMTIKRVF